MHGVSVVLLLVCVTLCVGQVSICAACLSRYLLLFVGFSFFFFKQKTAYEMRISDWSSDVCSSDLDAPAPGRRLADRAEPGQPAARPGRYGILRPRQQIGRASCRERVCQYV